MEATVCGTDEYGGREVDGIRELARTIEISSVPSMSLTDALTEVVLSITTESFIAGEMEDRR